jgi:hypothetical protein
MGSDFSAIDAELDTLETSPAADALALAHSYAGTALEFQAVDRVLNELDADGPLLRSRSSFPPPGRSARRAEPAAAFEPSREQIELPDPVPREPLRSEHGSGEMPLHATSSRSGSVSLDQHDPRAASTRFAGRDDTLEPLDEELIDADEELIEFTADQPSTSDSGGERRVGSLFDRKSQPAAAAQEEADAAFAELFSEAASQSIVPSASPGEEPETYGDDTETFDTAALGKIENDVRSPDASMDEELDSAEFEIVVDAGASKSAPPPGSRSPSEAPEKRPSFLGRLFGRKED